ncbi:enoyl-CoA hydratase/isomerase family protein [Flavobacterium johnsoniae]|uniref:Enoyl-CoA hydratase/isomerase n=1 Tax=Flavobacterium johnsoniae (strain ATCC 17061 / DSM 2064 / JCM 8514 / BCRC 14874 / CCUG 350202 / NBRC 14942 / NCIMB 11054 / UW101) TaxID=376686 RepID=A5FME3_FLAJ1|nr:enoyl-CoA hydratase/isomerase family protein [Flavobacterium johnsoniae]ABQ03633.1 Enoyl-CoA hydratase/isomerase [Flavobacterium johnsoniae UW101]OXE96051.1 enoyl-CoA hydratase [Flavobacterium johnsoniae UW101]WQG79504.1 enoyl-CoA hydratase/isomerase family protein [Flavobacterium johnsoniae UW101]SHL97611.1 methylglutaconyl-CoA hydratase [Flavobacterium johnsoniae]
MSSEIIKGSLQTSFQNTIATVQFGHPASNSFPRELLDRLTSEINELSRNEKVSVIILKSEGAKAFCSGASFDELLQVENEEQGTEFFSGFAHLINAMRNCNKLIIGRVQGKAVGGGVGIISACDYVFATQESDIKLSELAIGIGPFVIEPAVSRKIGKTAMVEMTLTAHAWKSAEWAFQKGLYSVLSNAENLDAEVENFAQKLSSYNPESLKEMKKIIWEGTEQWESLLFERAAITGKLVLSDFSRNALLQFKK